ncbi:hypothetical protein KKKH54_07700 [Helicobacter pylori]
MGLKNKIKGFVKERMPFVMRCVRGLKEAKNTHENAHDGDAYCGINHMERNKSIYKNSSLNYNYGGGGI